MSDEIENKQAQTLEALQQAGLEFDIVNEDELPSPRRTIGIGLVVDKHRELPEAAYNIAEFTNILREQVGEFDDIEIGVQINPQGNVPKERSKFMGFVQTDNREEDNEEDEEYFGDDEEDVDMKTFKMNKEKRKHK